MVAWSTRCTGCRRRKIKCDRQWPACGQCQKAKQHCSGPPERVKFVAENTAETVAEQLALVGRSESHPSFIITSNAQPKISPSVPGTHATKTGAELVSLLTSQAETFGFSNFAHLLRHVPAMLDSSPALTGAVSCLSDARKRQSTFPRPERKLDLKLYGSALRHLRYALQDSNELKRIETLLATLVMWRVEATIATTTELPYLLVTWSVHLAGVAYLLERLGPKAAKDELVFFVILESLSELSSHYYARDESFFLASPQWQQIFRERRDFPTLHRVLFVVFGQMSVFPDVMRDLRRYHTGQVNIDHVRSRVKSLCDNFSVIEEPLQAIMEDESLLRKRAASSSMSPVKEVYEVENEDITRVCCLYALASIVANNMLSAVDGDPSHELERKNDLLSRTIWMFHEQATKVGSFGMNYYPTALLLTYGSAKSREIEEWVVDLLNLLQERDPGTDAMWTRGEIVQRCYATSGNIWPSRPIASSKPTLSS
ncbi:hypothetical protein F4804DRAFT_314715 [Jackrogersella minutella]|nr:hypothetical protein F4804DRAFT_314715 [Jackrogersella minutella]